MKSNKEIKTGIQHCLKTKSGTCRGCPYHNEYDCSTKMLQDALELIEQMEQRLSVK